MVNFKEETKTTLKRLEQFVPVVDRVHGAHHPEFHNIKRVFEKINEKVKASSKDKPNLDNEFKELREITDNYTVPGDVCESYEAVFSMLSQVEEAYKA